VALLGPGGKPQSADVTAEAKAGKTLKLRFRVVNKRCRENFTAFILLGPLWFLGD
jgi:hypothetical protein